MARIVFRLLHTIILSARIKKEKNIVQSSAMIGANSLILKDLGHPNYQLMLLTGAVLVVNTNTTILKRS